MKQRTIQDEIDAAESHPVWVRGLKHTLAPEERFVHHVAPRVGAWIETAVTLKLFASL